MSKDAPYSYCKSRAELSPAIYGCMRVKRATQILDTQFTVRTDTARLITCLIYGFLSVTQKQAAGTGLTVQPLKAIILLLKKAGKSELRSNYSLMAFFCC